MIHIPKEELHDIYINKKYLLKDTAKYFNCSIKVINRHLKKYNLSRPKNTYYRDITGNKYSKLLVIKYVGNNKRIKSTWLCKCDCGNDRIIAGRSLISGLTRSCGCIFQENSEKNCNGILYTFWKTIQNRAKNRNIPFLITIEEAAEIFQKQKGKCALSGIPINLVKSHYHTDYKNQNASLDRIDNSQPYTKDNVQWVHKQINKMKHILSNEEFIILCKCIYLNNKEKADSSNLSIVLESLND